MREETISLVFIENDNTILFYKEINIIFHSFIKGILEKELEKTATDVSYGGFIIVARFMHSHKILDKIFSSDALLNNIRGEIAEIRGRNIALSDSNINDEEYIYEADCFIGGNRKLQSSQENVKGRVIITDQIFFARSKKIINQEAKNKDIFYLDVYINCTEFIGRLYKENMGHVIINKKDQDLSCYSEVIDAMPMVKVCNVPFVKTITKITYKEIANSRDSNRYIPEEKYYYMRKFMSDGEVELASDSIPIWLNAFLYSPVMCFSYGEDKNIHETLDEINYSLLKYLPFSNFYKDKRDSHAFRRLKDIIDVIKLADVVVAVINRKYLESFHAMDEIFDLYEKHKTEYDKYQYIGLIPYIMDDAREVIFDGKNLENIKNTWNLHCGSHSLNSTQKDKALKIKDNFDEIIQFFRDVYNHLPEEKHRENGYRVLAWAIYRHLVDHVECDVYDDIRCYDDFPKITT
ncbi:hypothetical protein HMY34_15400 [Thiothrix subterranea]|uniref:hypothetical protein n=1 Tax=Thiothrix subterranea TaxID=2735563 RepID=UPI00192CCD6B|nr:hypothetical protein [Thiothrix subterranea]QQZ30033.1 hypothetical protein HMY34_15400 [Thiothrix subterranea]